nr:hypothetical protein [Tanacetum cinerariifolium]
MPHLQPYHRATLLTPIRRRMKRTLRRILLTILPIEEIMMMMMMLRRKRRTRRRRSTQLRPTLLMYRHMILSPQAENTEAFETDESASTPSTIFTTTT